MLLKNVSPPSTLQRPHVVESPCGARNDPYFWLRDDARNNPEVLAHLAAENQYKDAVLAPLQPLIAALNEEIVARIANDDNSVPVLHRGYWYWTRVCGHLEHPVVLRQREDRFDGSLRAAQEARQAEVETVVDCNALAAGSPYFELGGYDISPDNRWVAFTEDVVGRRQYRLRIQDLLTGEYRNLHIENIDAGIVWCGDSRRVLYIEQHPETLLGVRVRCFELDGKEDALVYEEKDDSFTLSVTRSKSEQYLFIGSESTVTSEWRFAAANDPSLTFQLVAARERDHEYQVEHLGDRFIVRTNWQARNFRIMSAPLVASGDRAGWQEVVKHDAAVFIHEFDVFDDFLAIGERSQGLRRIRIRPWSTTEFYLEADEPAYALYLDQNPALQSQHLRYNQASLVAPLRTYEFDVAKRRSQLLKQEPVIGDFDAARYTSEFLWVSARDGVKVPVSLVRHRDTSLDGTAPLCLYGYGAYGVSMDPVFSSARLTLLDRGFVYAIAHVRGGQEVGRVWYDDGRLLNKLNSFRDFIDVRDSLVASSYAAADKVFATGGSAGGLLVAAVLNMAPQKFRGACVHVPFVDVVTTMLDESLPLTTLEYDEWGNPGEASFYRYILSYSPYDNVGQHPYPAVLASTGLWDSQVQYFEPAKWIARLRDNNTGTNPLLLRVNLEAGHGGESGRFRRYAEVAEEFAFMIDLADIPHTGITRCAKKT